MAGFKVALINEIEKLCKKKKFLLAIIISFIFIIAGQGAVMALRSRFGLRGASSMEFPILVLSILVNTILPLFTALVTIDSFSGEFSQNTMKISLTRPVTRFKYFTAKLTAIFIFILFNLILVMLISIFAGVLFNSNSFTLKAIINIVLSYLVTALPMLILAMVIAIISNILKSGVSVFFISVLVFLVFKVLELVFSRYSGIFFTSIFDWYNLWIISPFPVFKVLLKFMMLVSYGIILFTLGYYLFDKKDF